MQMGRAASAHSAQRVTMLLSEIIERTAQSESCGIEQSDSAGDAMVHERLRAWVRKREEIFPDEPRQSRTILTSPFQDDITVLSLGRVRPPVRRRA